MPAEPTSLFRSDAFFMGRACALARRGLYTTHPNPRVGCVIARDGEIVGEGFHRRAGGPHAEVSALEQAGAAAKGAVVYLTLEPCAHHGRTPPCCGALIKAGVARVVVAMRDPNPLTAGRGIEKLREAGIAVECGFPGDEGAQLNRGFVSRMTRARPWVRIKSALSLDGHIALASGDSTWISGAAARRDVQFWRAQSDALMTGSGTVTGDDPQLNVRLSADELGMEGEVRQPLRVVIDSGLKTPPSARIYSKPGCAVVATCSGGAGRAAAYSERGVEVLGFEPSGGRVPLAQLLATLAARFEINEVQVEAGTGLCGVLVEAGLCDELLLYLAPHLLGAGGRKFAEFSAIIGDMSRRIGFRYQDVRMVGDDLRILAVPNRISDFR